MAEEFPIDTATLLLLRAACEINPDSGHTELHSFLYMGSRVKDSTLIDGDEESDTLAGAPVYLFEYEPGYEPWSETSAIKALVDEVMRLRGVVAEGDE